MQHLLNIFAKSFEVFGIPNDVYRINSIWGRLHAWELHEAFILHLLMELVWCQVVVHTFEHPLVLFKEQWCFRMSCHIGKVASTTKMVRLSELPRRLAA